MISNVLGMFELLVIYLSDHVPLPIIWDAFVRARTIVLKLQQEKSNTSWLEKYYKMEKNGTANIGSKVTTGAVRILAWTEVGL
jgi:hypothetical protein